MINATTVLSGELCRVSVSSNHSGCYSDDSGCGRGRYQADIAQWCILGMTNGTINLVFPQCQCPTDGGDVRSVHSVDEVIKFLYLALPCNFFVRVLRLPRSSVRISLCLSGLVSLVTGLDRFSKNIPMTTWETEV